MEPCNTPLNTVVIGQIHFVEKVSRKRERTFRSSSLSGHLLHYVVEGEVEQECNGIRQTLTAGDVVWYEPNSIVKGEIKKSPWTFYTVSFDSPNLPFISADHRILNSPPVTGSLFEELLCEWHNRGASGLNGSLLITGCLYRILALCFPSETEYCPAIEFSSAWWEIESAYTQNIDKPPPTVAQLARRKNITLKKLNIICRMATGASPKARLQMVRMAHVKGLLVLSNLTISEVAYHTGYERVQDFSRACKSFFGVTPMEFRNTQQELKELPDKSL